MGGMRLVTQRVENQDAQAFQARPAFRRNLADVGAVGHVGDAKAEHVEMGVLESDRRHPFAEALNGSVAMRLKISFGIMPADSPSASGPKA